MTEQALIDHIDKLTKAVLLMAQAQGLRLTRSQMAERLGVHPNTIANRLKTDPRFPRPAADGKWLLAEVIEWESQQL